MSETATTVGRLRNGIAEEVRVQLARKRVSATELARQLGWSQTYMARRMVGVYPFNADDLEQIADALGVPIIELLPRSERRLGDTLGFATAPLVPTQPRKPERWNAGTDKPPAHLVERLAPAAVALAGFPSPAPTRRTAAMRR